MVVTIPDNLVILFGLHATREQGMCVMERRQRKSWPYRFWVKVAVGDSESCWPWLAGATGGYGTIRTPRGMERAHRIAWELTRGPVPVGLFVCHACDNPPCCNPDHLFIGTLADNNRDRHEKGRTKNLEAGRSRRHATLRSVTHCPRGHVYDESNTLIRVNGSRECRMCGRIETAKYLATNREQHNARRRERRRTCNRT